MKSKESSSATKPKEPRLPVPAKDTQGQPPRQPQEQEQLYANEVNDKNGNSNATLPRPRPRRTSPSVLRPRPNSGNGPEQQKVLAALKAKGITALELADQGDVQAPALLEWLYSAASTPQWVSDLVKNVLGLEVTAAPVATGGTMSGSAKGEDEQLASQTNPRSLMLPQSSRPFQSTNPNSKNNNRQSSSPSVPSVSAAVTNANAIRAARATRSVSGSDSSLPPGAESNKTTRSSASNVISSSSSAPSSTPLPRSKKPTNPHPQLQTKANGGSPQNRPQPFSGEKLTTQQGREIGEGEEKQVPPVLPITPGQIEMLDALLLKIGWGRAALERKTLKPMEQLTRNEARRWLAWLNEETKGKVSAARIRTVSKP